MQVQRLPDNPIIHPNLSESIGENINGPSLIRVPDWLANPLGKYYLYFAHHSGKHIRMAYADDLTGPWRIYDPGVLQLEDSLFVGHVASPDVHVDHDQKRIRMYYHGPLEEANRRGLDDMLVDYPFPPSQFSRVALSDDGLNFNILPEVITPFYLRVFEWDGWFYGITMPCRFYRSRDGLTNWEYGRQYFDARVRHCAVRLVGNQLEVYFSQREDCPEHIMMSRFMLEGDWLDWQHDEPISVLKPELDWEGADCDKQPSQTGAIHERVYQLRDPGIYEEDGRVYLIYSIAGESGLGIAELFV